MYEWTSSTTSAPSALPQKALASCKLSFQGARNIRELLMALDTHAVTETGSHIHLVDLKDLMYATDAARFFPPGLVRHDRAHLCSGDLAKCFSSISD